MPLGDLIGSDYGMRQDGTPKGNGYYGKLERPGGGVSTELSFDFESGGKNIFAPLLVPGLSRAEIEHLLSGERPTPEIYQKAQNHAMQRILSGKPTFAQPNEIVPLPSSGRLQDLLNGRQVPNPNIRPPTAPMIGVRG